MKGLHSWIVGFFVMDGLVKLNRSHIAKAKGDKNTPSIRQFNCLGYKAPFLGWEEEILNMVFTMDQIHGFMNKHNPLKSKKKNRRKKRKKPIIIKEPIVKKDVYSNDLWDEKRRAIYKRDDYRCVKCGLKGKLNAHHLLYEDGKELWEVPDFYLVSLCDNCHKEEHSKKLIAPRKVY